MTGKGVFKFLVLVALVAIVSGASFAAVKCIWEDPNLKMADIVRHIAWDPNKWDVVLANGRLDLKLLDKNNELILVDNGVSYFSAVGTGIGPVIVYKNGNDLYYFHRDTKGEVRKNVIHKGDVVSVSLVPYKEGVYVRVITPGHSLFVYWVDTKGPALIEEGVPGK